MLDAHRGMNISEQEFNTVVDDMMDALAKNSVGQREKDEILSIMWSMRKEIVHV
jgi:hemoglobin